MSVELSETKPSASDALFSASAFKQLTLWWLKEQIPLVEAACIALALHVLSFPMIWFLGWALPWPKSPVVTTVIELDLQHWPLEAKTKQVLHIRYPALNQ